MSVVVEWLLETHGGNSPVTYNITSCPIEGGECVQTPLVDSYVTHGLLSETLKGLQPAIEYEITISANTTRDWGNGTQDLLTTKDPVVYSTTTRGNLSPYLNDISPYLKEKLVHLHL